MSEITIDKIIRSKRRTVALEISAEGLLLVRIPNRISLDRVKKFIKEKESWIKKKQEYVKIRVSRRFHKQFNEGEEFLYLGKPYPLKIVDVSLFPIYFDNGFYITRDTLTHARELFIRWYKEEARRVLNQRVQMYAKTLNLTYNQIKISSAEKRWGSCSHKGNLNFNWRLILTSIDSIDYVVVHELAHLIHHNHSKEFWNTVSCILPDYQKRRKWLRENGNHQI
jgi:predicted metal-dependent hydrolase